MREITNGQLSIEESAKRLISKTLSILKDMATDEDLSIRKYTRTAQLVTDGVAFQLLRNQVTIKAMKLLEAEWITLEADIAADQPLGDCHCQILLRLRSCLQTLSQAHLRTWSAYSSISPSSSVVATRSYYSLQRVATTIPRRRIDRLHCCICICICGRCVGNSQQTTRRRVGSL